MTPDRMEQLQDALDRMGNTHSLEDIIALIQNGEMQSFVEGDTWAVTQLIDFPRRRVLEVFLVVGDMDAALKLYDQVMAFAQASGSDIVRCYARDGWGKWAKPRGWTNGQRVFVKEI